MLRYIFSLLLLTTASRAAEPLAKMDAAVLGALATAPDPAAMTPLEKMNRLCQRHTHSGSTLEIDSMTGRTHRIIHPFYDDGFADTCKQIEQQWRDAPERAAKTTNPTLGGLPSPSNTDLQTLLDLWRNENSRK
jgi:hypothetical protein